MCRFGGFLSEHGRCACRGGGASHGHKYGGTSEAAAAAAVSDSAGGGRSAHPGALLPAGGVPAPSRGGGVHLTPAQGRLARWQRRQGVGGVGGGGSGGGTERDTERDARRLARCAVAGEGRRADGHAAASAAQRACGRTPTPCATRRPHHGAAFGSRPHPPVVPVSVSVSAPSTKACTCSLHGTIHTPLASFPRVPASSDATGAEAHGRVGFRWVSLGVAEPTTGARRKRQR